MATRLMKGRPRFEWSELEKFAPWLLFLGICWICWLLASLFWFVLVPPTAPLARAVQLGGATSSSVPNVIGFKFFAESGGNAPSAQANLPMSLEGVFVAQPVERSAAVIKVKDLSSRYRIGQQLDGTPYKLVAVDWNQVSLQGADGGTQQLKFGDGKASLISNSAVHESQSLPPAAVPNQNQTQASLGDAVRQMKENPNAYLGQMGLAQAGGKGYEVTDSVPANVRAQMGLKTGDRIVSVNGQSVGNPANDAQLLQQVQQSHNASVQIQRGDQTLTVQQNF